MTTFAKSGFRSLNYDSLRPHYPASFYDVLARYLGKKEVQKTLDLGCGTAVATFPLLNISKQVHGIDLSPAMIKTANDLKEERLKKLGISDTSRITFAVSAVEDLEEESSHYDLITAAECIHWFKDYDSFFASAAKDLKPKGTLAYWYYVDPAFVGFNGPADSSKTEEEICRGADKIYAKYAYNDPDWFGPHWEQPGRSILQATLVKVDKAIPSDLFEEVKIRKYDAKYGNPPGEDDLQLSKENIPLATFAGYMTTFSSAHNYAETKGEGSLEHFKESILAEFEKELGWDREKTTVNITWNTGYTFMKKK